MVIFHSYVKLPEGRWCFTPITHKYAKSIKKRHCQIGQIRIQMYQIWPWHTLTLAIVVIPNQSMSRYVKVIHKYIKYWSSSPAEASAFCVGSGCLRIFGHQLLYVFLIWPSHEDQLLGRHLGGKCSRTPEIISSLNAGIGICIDKCGEFFDPSIPPNS